MGGGNLRIPDYRIYKVQDAPQLLQLQEKLAQHGLKDPWLRNEVWRYTMAGVKGETPYTVFCKSMFRGFPYAVALVTGFILAEKAYHKAYPPHDHGHGHH